MKEKQAVGDGKSENREKGVKIEDKWVMIRFDTVILLSPYRFMVLKVWIKR